MISGVAMKLKTRFGGKGYTNSFFPTDLRAQTRPDLEKAALEATAPPTLVMIPNLARENPAHREPVNLNELAARWLKLRPSTSSVAKPEVIHPTGSATPPLLRRYRPTSTKGSSI